ncbi:hypothetical protein REPUB_Repub18cG0125500 [Reevesia pubescens]
MQSEFGGGWKKREVVDPLFLPGDTMVGSLAQKKSYAQVLKHTNSEQLNQNTMETVKLVDNSKLDDQVEKSSCKSKDSVLSKLKSCIGFVDAKAMHRLDRCVVGTARDYYETRTIMENFRMSGVSGITAKKISGRQFLIEFDDDSARQNMEIQKWAWLREWFTEIEPWSVFFYAQYRTTWITIFGVPLHAWNETTDPYKDMSTINKFAKLDEEGSSQNSENEQSFQSKNSSSCSMKVDGNELINAKFFNTDMIDSLPLVHGNNTASLPLAHGYNTATDVGNMSPRAAPNLDVNNMENLIGSLENVADSYLDKNVDDLEKSLGHSGSFSVGLGNDLKVDIETFESYEKELSDEEFDLVLSNKMGAKSIAEIEDAILEKATKKGKKRGRRPKNIFKLIPAINISNRVANSSLSDSDFRKRMEALCKSATEAWELGKKIGFSANCEDSLFSGLIWWIVWFPSDHVNCNLECERFGMRHKMEVFKEPCKSAEGASALACVQPSSSVKSRFAYTWSPPNPWFAKFNVDAAVSIRVGLASCGGVLRDAGGNIITIFLALWTVVK